MINSKGDWDIVPNPSSIRKEGFKVQKRLLLRDYLNHDKYKWPLTMVSYQLTFEEEVKENAWVLKNSEGKEVPFQISNVCIEEGSVKSLTLHFLTNLSKGARNEFYFQSQEEEKVKRKDIELNASFELNIDKDNHGFSVAYQDKRMLCSIPFENLEYRIVNTGSIFEEIEIVCKGDRDQQYVLNVRRIARMPFWELRESMSGFEENEQTPMQITFENFDFTHRYSAFRPVEKIDEYLSDNNRMPVIVMPYENYVSWFQSKYIAFLGEDYSAGLFIRDNLEWDDGKYPIWGSNKDFGISFSYENEKVTAHFPLKNGKRFVGITAYEGTRSEYIKELWKWYTFYHLNKVKDWVLDWEENQYQYPMFFHKEQGKPIQAQEWHYKKGEMLDGRKMTEVIDQLSCSVNGDIDIEDRGMDPVRNREFACWTVILDLTADEMAKKEFDRAKAVFAFMAYATKDEDYMPTENMLAGHPNFLADTASVSGFFAALFPNHPEKKMFRQYFNKAVALNMKYHIRPDVAGYESLGGRETENLGGYCFAMLRPFIHVCKLFEKCGYDNPLSCEKGAKWLNWMTNCMSAPVAGRRTKPPQGAHSRKVEIPYILYEMAQMLEKEYPEVAQNTFAVCEGSSLENFEAQSPEDDIWRTLFNRDEEKGKLTLKSEKFTGYGCILREAVGTPDEISVHVQQLDLGPNYRWGCFENTGNGGIYYFAAGKRYSFNAPEDTGDKNMGAEEGNCGFSVLKGHTYHNIGFHDLTEPLRDLPVIKQIKLMAGEDIKDFYKFRRVSLVEKDYLVLYDAVTHMRAWGKFLWTVNELEEFPEIWQLRPGAAGRYCKASAAEWANGYGNDRGLKPDQRSKSVAYDGFGNFLTVVSHRKDLCVESTEYGALVSLPDRVDYLFEDAANIRYRREELSFSGNSGIISRYKNGAVRGALLEGKQIGCDNLRICLEGKGAIFFESKGECWEGSVIANEPCTIQINGRTVFLDKGKYIWKWNGEITLAKMPERIYSGIDGFVRDTRKHEWGFSGTDFQAMGEILSYPEG